MELIEPSVAYKDSFIAAVREFQADADNSFRTQVYQKLDISALERDFGAIVEEKHRHARGEGLPEGYVPYSDFWLVDDGEYIGRLTIRHTLNETLKCIGGHVGYDIRPSMRGRGYGTAILKLGLERAKALGIGRVLLTCDESNAGSRKIIEKNGGVFENSVPSPEGKGNKLRFWIEAR